MHWIYLIHEFHNLSWITEINELFHDILIYWDAPVYIFILITLSSLICMFIYKSLACLILGFCLKSPTVALPHNIKPRPQHPPDKILHYGSSCNTVPINNRGTSVNPSWIKSNCFYCHITNSTCAVVSGILRRSVWGHWPKISILFCWAEEWITVDWRIYFYSLRDDVCVYLQ